VIDLANERVRRGREPLELERDLHLAIGRRAGERLAEQRRQRVGLGATGQDVVLVLGGERGVLACAGHGGPHLFDRRIRGVRVAQPSAGDEADADAARLAELQPLDLAPVRLDLGVTRLLGVGLDGLLALGRSDGGVDQLPQVRHRCPRP
jgi:hypothetical protein